MCLCMYLAKCCTIIERSVETIGNQVILIRKLLKNHSKIFSKDLSISAVWTDPKALKNNDSKKIKCKNFVGILFIYSLILGWRVSPCFSYKMFY